VVYASTTKLFLKTKRLSYYSANQYVNFVLRSLVKNQKFSFLALKIKNFYKLMLFEDIHNYTGIVVSMND